MKIATLTVALALGSAGAAGVTSMSAQDTGHVPVRVTRPMPQRMRQPDTQRDAHRDAQRRVMLEQRFKQRSEQIVLQRLKLNDDQAHRLRSVNADIGGKRDALLDQERQVRVGLRDEMQKGPGADQRRISDLMRQAHDLQARRFALQQDEERQLSDFMSPIQVAQYIGLQAQIRQRIREMQRDGGDGGPGPRPW